MTDPAAASLLASFTANLHGRKWQPFRAGIEASWLYQNGPHGAAAAYLRYAPGGRAPFHWHAGYEHVFVLEGTQSDRAGTYGPGSVVINPPGSAHEVVSEQGCIVLVIWERPVIFGTGPEGEKNR